MRQAGNRDRHAPRTSLQSLRKFQQPRRAKDMSICIAAMYGIGKGDNPGILLVSDQQETDTKTNFKAECATKVCFLAPHIMALGSGDLGKFHDLIIRVENRLRHVAKDSLRVQDVVKMYRQAEDDWKQEYLERHVLYRYGVNWKSLEERIASEQVTQSFLDNVFQAVNACEIPFLVDVIIAGWDWDGIPKIFSITVESVDDRSSHGFATIGEGYEIADIEFKTNLYLHSMLKSAVLFKSFVAKRRAESIASVGRQTTVCSIEPGKGCDSLDYFLVKKVGQLYDEMKEAQFRTEIGFYTKTETLLNPRTSAPTE